MKLVFTLIMFLFVSCDKENICEDCLPEIFSGKNATVLYTGTLAVDGCDWCILSEDSVYYHPDNLSNSFMQNQLQVTISYKKTSERFYCGNGNGSNGLEVIHILEIE